MNEDEVQIMGDVYVVVNTAKTAFPQSRLVLSGVLRGRVGVMAPDRSITRQIRLDSETTGNYICRYEQLDCELGLHWGWTAHKSKWNEKTKPAVV
jgi:hypothetical protein